MEFFYNLQMVDFRYPSLIARRVYYFGAKISLFRSGSNAARDAPEWDSPQVLLGLIQVRSDRSGGSAAKTKQQQPAGYSYIVLF